MSWAVIGFALQTLLWKRKMARKESMTEEEKNRQEQEGVTGDAKHDFSYVRALSYLGFPWFILL